ncbi:MAG TPA: 50S ribosomal protein L23 [Phycisphaerae bacterium]|nr:50S ribosomal protein L23 [Phycisphaerae bacterium]
MKHDVHNVLIRPLVTEKGTHQAQTRNAYAFEVAVGANKAQIRQAIEAIYKVKVLGVRTANYRGKPRRTGMVWGTTKRWKKAVVELAPEHRIDLF